jgi:F0F1-type ATP synthase assembly protein I
LLRAVLSFPFVIIALVEHESAGLVSSTTVNQDLLNAVGKIDWTRADVAWVSDLYPPIGTILATLVPGGTLGLGIAGSVVAGIFLQQMIQAMYQRRFLTIKIVTFTLALAANPLFAFTVTTNFEGFLGLAFFGIGAINMVRFIAQRNTQAGFRAGILFMLAALSSPSGLIYVLIAGLTAPLMTLARKGQKGARASNILVILFPTIATFVTVAFLQAVFLHSPFGILNRVLDYRPENWAVVPMLFSTLNGFLLLAPVVSGWAFALLVRRPGAILISTILFAALVVGRVIGLIPENSAGTVFIIMTMIGIAILPHANTTRASVLITAVAALQIVIAWAAAYNRPVVLDWMHSLAQTFGWN